MNLTTRLLEWMLGPLLFFWIVSMGTAYMVAKASSDTATDQHLETVLAALSAEWQEARDKAARVDFPSRWVRQWLLDGPVGPVRFVILDSRWEVSAGDTDLGAALQSFQPVFQKSERAFSGESAEGIDLTLGQNRYRVRSARVSLDPDGDPSFVLVAQDKAIGAPMIRNILLGEAIPQSAVLLLAMALVLYGITYLGRPMSDLRRQLAERSADNLRPIELRSIPRELEPLIEALNSLIERLQQSLAAQHRFISDAAHQLRTPLAALRTQTELLLNLPEGEQKERALQRLLSTAKRASRLANQLLSLARAESAATSGELDTVDVLKLCESVVTDVADVAIEKDLELSFDRDESDFRIRGDPTLLGEMIRNLLDNAFKYTPRGGSVLLQALGATRTLVVEDSGPGIAEADREAVFAPFARRSVISNETGHLIGGTGLGLAIVREVIRQHGGSIAIETSQWGGARFVVRLPANKAASA